MSDFKLGETVWFEPDDPRDKGFEAEIIKVGRKYYTLSTGYWTTTVSIENNSRIEYPCGVIYKNKQEVDDMKLAYVLWIKLKEMYSLKVSLNQIKKIYDILGLEIPHD